ncbi:MFS transporter, partial [Streptomyces albidoflavus]
SVLDGLRFLATRPNIRMTFFTDLCAMVLAHPRRRPARPAGHPGAGPAPAGAPGRSPVRALPDAGLRQAPRGDRPLMTRNVAVTVAALAWIATIAVLTARL